MNPYLPINSVLAMPGLVAARMEGAGNADADAVLAGFWEGGLKMDDPTVMQGVIGQAILDGGALLGRTQDPVVKHTLMPNTEAAMERGAFGIPTFVVGDEMVFGKERLGQVEEALR